MTEVFRTNVIYASDAKSILDAICTHFPTYSANFDLSDCDRILRIKSKDNVDHDEIFRILGEAGFWCEVLPDEVPEPYPADFW